MDSVIRQFFNTQVSFKGASEVGDRIRRGHERLRSMPLERREKETEKIAKSIRNEICVFNHPIVKKVHDWGRLKGRTKYAENLKQTIRSLLDRGITSTKDYEELEEKIGEFKRGLMKDIEKALKEVGDLRHYHTPGSVARTEAMNLYFGEDYDRQALYRLGVQLMDSTCIGSNIAVYFDDQELREDMQEELIRELGSWHVSNKDLGQLKIHRLENREPYLVLLKLLLWLYERIEAGKLHYRIMDILKQTEGIIYFTPGREKVKYSTIPLPRLDLFFINWLEVNERREALKRMRDSLYSFMRGVERNARRVRESKAAQNELNLLVAHYNMLCTYLLRSGLISQESLRGITDLVLELSGRYKVDISLSFAKELTSP